MHDRQRRSLSEFLSGHCHDCSLRRQSLGPAALPAVVAKQHARLSAYTNAAAVIIKSSAFDILGHQRDMRTVIPPWRQR